jgi:hypothetical protein
MGFILSLSFFFVLLLCETQAAGTLHHSYHRNQADRLSDDDAQGVLS